MLLKIIDFFLKEPSSFEEQKKDEIGGITFIVISYSMLFFYILLTCGKWNLKVIKNVPGLFIISVGLALGFLFVAIRLYHVLKKLKKANTFAEIKECKLSSYLSMVIFGVPYNAMAFWLFFNNRIWEASVLLVIYFGAAVSIYFKDWKPFLRLLERAH